MLLKIFLLFAVVAMLYMFVLRPKLKSWFPGFYAWLDPMVAALWAKSRTLLMARLTWVGGLVSGASAVTGGVDWTAVAHKLVAFLPAQYQDLGEALLIPVAIATLGGIFEWLRHVTAPLPTADAKE